MASEAEVRLNKKIESLQAQVNALSAELRKLYRVVTHPSTRTYIQKYSVLKTEVGNLLGTTNQIIVTNGLDCMAKNEDVTLSTPQNIHTGASPTFAGLTIGTLDGLLKGTTGVVGVAVLGTDYYFPQLKRVSAQFDKDNITLANVTDLSVSLSATKKYAFEACLFVDADAVGGHKYTISGTATATDIIFEVLSFSNVGVTPVITSRHTALDSSVEEVGATEVYTMIRGTILVNVAGTLTVKFAQSVANNTSSVLDGSYFIVREIS